MIFAQQRQQMVELCHHLSSKGYFAGTGGNIMQRLDDVHVLVTPSATDYLSMGAADIAVLRLKNLEKICGKRAPSVESALHASVLRKRSDVRCSIHTHQPIASACALLGVSLAVPPQLQGSLGRKVPMVGYGPSGTLLLTCKLARQVRPGINGYLLRNHGVLCVGQDSQQALQALDDLERLTQLHLAALIERQAQRRPRNAQIYQQLLSRLHEAGQ
ncbi:class II aldolase/adducin family protein [Pseudomonas sp. 5P_3.1_Bac2]|uniref:class II aldolase/adducin family protein n=1 Tax=Pseudomonas sp. 5P_3.1_Bac2 TaxID=2971617 RepID=UPI0021C71023|nr:class II aldolase/adducin family protein [Pseudomonas sp. 5P_3.1_Bac2]MCU1717378.1 class II aldolase/adducin family protein [Pseudomonas sp. 5P_3.1_Bac2]